jgi:hypothetical protein
MEGVGTKDKWGRMIFDQTYAAKGGSTPTDTGEGQMVGVRNRRVGAHPWMAAAKEAGLTAAGLEAYAQQLLDGKKPRDSAAKRWAEANRERIVGEYREATGTPGEAAPAAEREPGADEGEPPVAERNTGPDEVTPFSTEREPAEPPAKSMLDFRKAFALRLRKHGISGVTSSILVQSAEVVEAVAGGEAAVAVDPLTGLVFVRDGTDAEAGADAVAELGKWEGSQSVGGEEMEVDGQTVDSTEVVRQYAKLLRELDRIRSCLKG